MKSVLFFCAIFLGFSAFADSYGRQSGHCEFFGYSEDIDVRPHPMPLKLTSDITLTYVVETANVLRSSFSNWQEDPNATIHLDPSTMGRLNTWSFYSNNNGSKEIWMYHFQPTDWINLLSYLSQTQLDPNQPWKFADMYWSDMKGGTWTVKYTPVMDPKCAFMIEETGSRSFIMQINLPPNVSNGLSFHLQGSCAFTDVP
jgi:hypothetical protein